MAGNGAGDAAADKWSKILPVSMVFLGCMSSIVSMEYVLKGDATAGNLLTFTEFAVVLLQCLPGRMEPKQLRLRPLLASWSSHAVHAVLWVSMSVLVNYAFAFNISVPMHTLFRSCNVIASVMVGWIAFGCRYSWQQLVCIAVISAGILCGSIGDARKVSAAPKVTTSCVGCSDPQPAASASADDGFLTWTYGIGILIVVMLVQASLGHIQAMYYKNFADRGSRNELADEYLFTSHVVSFLPVFLLWDDIVKSFFAAIATPACSPLFPVPTRVCWMMLNNLTQLVCIKGVFRLTAHCSPLTVNITLSVRKFSSVLFSIFWFGNPWTEMHTAATVAIFSGVFAYTQCPGAPARQVKDRKKAE